MKRARPSDKRARPSDKSADPPITTTTTTIPEQDLKRVHFETLQRQIKAAEESVAKAEQEFDKAAAKYTAAIEADLTNPNPAPAIKEERDFWDRKVTELRALLKDRRW